MPHLIAVTFGDEMTAFGLRAALGKLQKDYLIDMQDVVVVTRDEQGKATLHQATTLTAAGARTGSFWGPLIGTIFLNPLPGAAVGAGAGEFSGRLTELGIDDRFAKTFGEGLPNGGSALLVLVRTSIPDQILASLEPFLGRGRVVQTSLSETSERKLRDLLEKDPA